MEHLFANLSLGFGVALSVQNLLYCLIGCLLGLTACAGEKPAPDTPAADSAPAPAVTDSAGRGDTTRHRGDSVMVRDTASGV